jgi:hypothetical protein
MRCVNVGSDGHCARYVDLSGRVRALEIGRPALCEVIRRVNLSTHWEDAVGEECISHDGGSPSQA